MKNFLTKFSFKEVFLFTILDLLLSGFVMGVFYLSSNATSEMSFQISSILGIGCSLIVAFLLAKTAKRNFIGNAALFVFIQTISTVAYIGYSTGLEGLSHMVANYLIWFGAVVIGSYAGYFWCKKTNGAESFIDSKMDLIAITLILMLLFSDRYFEIAANQKMARSGQENASLQFKNVAEEINKNLPMMVDANTRLDSTTSEGDNFIYSYTLVNNKAEEIDKDFSEMMKSKIINATCTSGQMDIFRKNEIKILYSYLDKNGKFITEIAVDTTKCDSLLRK